MDHLNDTAAFTSDFALEQLRAFAGNMDELDFVLMFMPIFGSQVPSEIFLRLRADLLAGALSSPGYAVEDRGQDNARYDSEHQLIVVNPEKIELALTTPSSTPSLLMALLGTFGQYLADLYASDDSDWPKPQAQELRGIGSRYASLMAFCDGQTKDGTVFAHYTSDEHDAALYLDVSEAPAVDELLPEDWWQAYVGPRFGAGDGGHESVEEVLSEVGFTQQECKAIYFGNWIRDHSQLIDPKLVRPEHAPKQFPKKLSRETLTQVVDMLALKAFGSLQQSEAGREAYRVTQALLGVYRPSEHIDNPTNLEEDPVDPKTIDEDFEPLVLPDDPDNEVYYSTSMKAYMDGPARYMNSRIYQAAAAGRTPQGMRLFGEALHVLEDYFAHSNFVELSLRKLGYEDVLPWTTQVPCRHGYPVVTGLFSGLDILASIAEPLSKMLFPATPLLFEPLKAGYRSDAEQMMLILLREQENPIWLKSLENMLAMRDRIADNPLLRFAHLGFWALTLPLRLVGHYCNRVFQSLLVKLGDLVDELQTHLGDDPNTSPGVDPTHSQLAKDHDTHPFHTLAMLLAREAVRQVGTHMQAHWSGEDIHPPADLAVNFLCHPNDCDWQDAIVAEWASAHQAHIEAGRHASEFDRLRDEYMAAAREKIRALGVNDNYTPVKTSESFRTLFPFH
ncbi:MULTISPECIES: HET-C-related protein [unclassified Pseudomonas]|uniref:HET-C-related protein n=1 Tax=unclassified Pseudomonas TaxID=196821 RepID=UPI00244CE6F6|nr:MULTISPECIES: HET-C-related protein [unclassified Pseudomonas]MDH0304661.1 Het-C domain-containing protein [Pseudomonas sp. GD04091]MDH1987764.1 Het-C domain-containing protein [Pseudomonas sp. GD03689]